MKFGYARGGADDPDLTRQRAVLEWAGCISVFEDAESGVAMVFPSLNRCLAMPRRGDTLVCQHDRLARRRGGLAAIR
jgi:resolvase-like protein